MMLHSSKKHIPIFLILSFAISWAIWIPVAFSRIDYQSSPYLLAAVLVGAFGPGLAAIIVNYIDSDLLQISEFRQRIYDFKRIRPAWYLIILVIWPVLHGIAIGITTLIGAPIPESGFLAELVSQPNTIPLVVFLYFLQAMLEELGWRGYLQDKLGQKLGPSLSSLLIGLIHNIWYLPLFWVVGTNQMKMGFGSDFLIFISFVITSSVISAWCYYGNRRSLMAVTLLRVIGKLSFDIFGYSPSTTKHFVFVLLTVIGAGLILIYFQISSRKSLSETETSSL